MYQDCEKIRLGLLAVLFTHAEVVHFSGIDRDFTRFNFFFVLSLPFTGFLVGEVLGSYAISWGGRKAK